MRRRLDAIGSRSNAARTSLQCANRNDVGFGLEVVAFRLVLAAERHCG
jgi:hypothetical protein